MNNLQDILPAVCYPKDEIHDLRTLFVPLCAAE